MTQGWTNNYTESQNNVLEHQTEWKLLKLPDLIQKVHILTETQFKQLGRSFTQTGEFIFSTEYKKCALNPQQWAVKSEDQKTKLKAKFIKSRKPQANGTETSTDGKLTVPVKPSAGKKPGQFKRRRAAKTTTIKP